MTGELFFCCFFFVFSVWILSASTLYVAVCVTVHFTTFPKGSIWTMMSVFSFRTHTALVVEFIQLCLVRFIYLSSANRVPAVSVWMCWLPHIQAYKILGLKAKLNSATATVSLWRRNSSKYKQVGRKRGNKKNWKCNSYFYRSTSLIFWEGEIADSFAVITFTCTLAELFMKDLNRGYEMGKRLFTNNTKSKKALKWTKMSHQTLDHVSGYESRYKDPVK